MTPGKILYAKLKDTYILKFIGEIRYTISFSLTSFLEKMFADKGFNNILIDLTQTENIDSTNLGLLAKIANFMQQHFQRKATIVSTNQDINKVLDSIGFYDVFVIAGQAQPIDDNMQDIPQLESSEQEMAEMILEAHRTLSELNDKNEVMFKDVVESLENELANKQ